MDRLDAMRVFVRVVETGSFSKAAKLEGIAQSTASKHVAELERRLGCQLLRRTPRAIAPTPQGADHYDALVPILAALEAAEARVAHAQDAVAGTLRVGVPSALARLHVIPALGALMERHPKLEVELDVSDRRMN